MNLHNRLQKLTYLGIGSLLSIILVGCGNQHSKELSADVTKIKEKIFSAPETKNIADIPMPKPVTYQSAGLRSPFASSASSTTATSATAEAASPLNEFSVNALRFVGTVQEHNKIWGIILTPTNKLYQITIGDYIGSQYAKIINIYRDHIEMLETVTENAKTTQRRIVLRLKEEK